MCQTKKLLDMKMITNMLIICEWNSRNWIFWMWHMEYGSGSGYPATSGGDNQNNGSRMQQTDRQQQSGLAYHHVPHQINQGKEFLASVSRYYLYYKIF